MSANIYDSNYIRSLFDRMSDSYERMNYITSFGFSSLWRKQFLKHLHSSNDEIRILDLMTGMGETWPHIVKNFPKAQLSALDFSKGMLNQAEKRNEKYFNKSVTVLMQDVLKNNLPSGHFDHITCAFGLKTFNKYQIHDLALEVKRLLKDGGRFTFIEVSIPQSAWLRLPYAAYLKIAVPLAGKLFLGNTREYNMLHKYTSKYQNSREVLDAFSNAGLHVAYDEYFFGCATGIHGYK